MKIVAGICGLTFMATSVPAFAYADGLSAPLVLLASVPAGVIAGIIAGARRARPGLGLGWSVGLFVLLILAWFTATKQLASGILLVSLLVAPIMALPSLILVFFFAYAVSRLLRESFSSRISRQSQHEP